MRNKPPSLLWRIGTRLTAVTVLGALILYGWVFYTVRLATNQVTEGSVLDQAERIAAAIRVDETQSEYALPHQLADTPTERDGSFRYAVTDGAGLNVLSSRWPTAALASIHHPDSSSHLYLTDHDTPGGRKFYGAIVAAAVNGKPVTIQVERSGEGDSVLVETLIDEFFEHGAWVTAPFLAALLLISIVTIRSAVSALAQVSREAAAIGPDESGRRLPECAIPREVLPLVRAVNLALDRLDAALAQQRAFTADAAHELRTPLAVLRAQAETLPDGAAAAALRSDIDRMARIVAQLLKIAQLDSSAIDLDEQIDLGEVVIGVADLLNPIAIEGDTMLEVTVPQSSRRLAGNREIVFLAIRNVVENALRHAPRDSSVELSLDDDGSVRVVDHGPGIPVADRERIFTRFWRADRMGAGAGLGLAMVAKAVELHNGTIEVGDTPGGGATFILRFQSHGESGAANRNDAGRAKTVRPAQTAKA